MEGWKHGRMEAWKHGRVEEWKNGSMEAWTAISHRMLLHPLDGLLAVTVPDPPAVKDTVLNALVGHVLPREPQLIGALPSLLLHDRKGLRLKDCVSEVEDHDERVGVVVLSPAEIEVMADDCHGKGAVDLGEPLLA